MLTEPKDYGFAERMEMSQGVSAVADVRTILLREIPGAQNVHAAAPCNDKKGVDWWIEMANGAHLAVDTKVREMDWSATHPKEDDLALETWSVLEAKKVGWTRDSTKRCDYVLWLWLDTGRFCLLPFPFLLSVFEQHWTEWTNQFRTARQRTPCFNGREYHSECVFVPRRTIWAAIYRRVGGDARKAS